MSRRMDRHTASQLLAGLTVEEALKLETDPDDPKQVRAALEAAQERMPRAARRALGERGPAYRLYSFLAVGGDTVRSR